MSTISPYQSQKQTASSDAVNEAINDSLVNNVEDATQGEDEDGSTHKAAGHKGGKGGKKATAGLGGHTHAHGASATPGTGDHVAAKGDTQQAPQSPADPLGTDADSKTSASTSGQAFEEVSDLALSGTQGKSGKNAASSAATAQGAPASSSATGTQKTQASAADIATAAQASLAQVLAAPTATTAQVNTATDKFISAMKQDGATDAQIGTKLQQLTSASSATAANSASALVEAAKNGINTDDSNKDKESSIQVQKALNKKKDSAIAAGQQAQQQAAQQVADYSDSGGGGGSGYGGGSSDGSGSTDGSSGTGSTDSAQSYSGTGQAGGTAADTPANAPTNAQVMSMDELKTKVPARLAALFPTIEAAAQKYNLQPQLLVAIAMQESTGGTDPSAYSNGGGMFQFTSEDTWKAYGSGSRSDDQASAWACAKYMAACINDTGNLTAALREYNGPVGQGGKPSYQSDIYNKMKGIDLGN